MDSLAGYVATACVGVGVTYLSQFLIPRVKVHFWLSHSFLYTMPVNAVGNPAPPALPPAQQPALPGQPQAPPQAAGPAAPPAVFYIQTHSLTIQNFGRKPAEWVEIVHRGRPDFFQFYPSLNYTESMTPSNEHVLRTESLAPKEFVTLQLLSYLHQPELLYIRSEAGHASAMPSMAVRKYPNWAYAAARLLCLIGAGFSAYWLIRGAIFVLKGLHVL